MTSIVTRTISSKLWRDWSVLRPLLTYCSKHKLSTKPELQQETKDEETAKQCQEYAHTRLWKLGTFTNATCEFGAVTRLPDLCIFLNTMQSVVEQHTAVTHAAKMCIPTVGIVDTNCDPKLITYPVPGNDDTPCAIELYCKLFKEAVMRGKKYKNEMLARDKI